MSVSDIISGATNFTLGVFFVEAAVIKSERLRTTFQNDCLNALADGAGSSAPCYRLKEFIDGIHSADSNLLNLPLGGKSVEINFDHTTFSKINCIKEVRSASQMGLKEAKDFVERYVNGIYGTLHFTTGVDSSAIIRNLQSFGATVR